MIAAVSRASRGHSRSVIMNSLQSLTVNEPDMLTHPLPKDEKRIRTGSLQKRLVRYKSWVVQIISMYQGMRYECDAWLQSEH